MKHNKAISAISILIIVTLFTFSVGKVTRVQAAATTAAIAAAALALTGATVYAYVYFTGGNQYINTDSLTDITNKFREIGTKAIAYTTPQYIYNKALNWVRHNGIDNLQDYDITLDAQTLEGLYEDFNDVTTLQDIFDITHDGTYQGQGVIAPTDTFNADKMPYEWYRKSSWGSLYQYESVINSAPIVFIGTISVWPNKKVIYTVNGTCKINGDEIVIRNATSWTRFADTRYAVISANNGEFYIDQIYFLKGYELVQVQNPPTVINGNNIQKYPNWNNNDNNDYYPIVPYVELPSQKSWGINFGELGQKLMDIGEEITELATIAELLQSLADSDPDNYIEYNQGDTNYRTYYTYNVSNDTYNYVQQNIENDNMPVDLNKIKEYTSNKYITQLQNDGQVIGQTIADTLAVIHNIDYEILYILLGGAIFTLICALIGKAGK